MTRLQKIEVLKNLRNFVDFNSGYELKRHEVLYAPNGSGKTNLGRILAHIQDPNFDLNTYKSKEATMSDRVQFSITIDENVITENNYSNTANQNQLGNLLVFNSDYIAKNVSCSDFSNKELDGEVTLELGKEDSDIKAIEKATKAEKERIKQAVETLENALPVFIQTLRGSTYKAVEHNIWHELELSKILRIDPRAKENSEVLTEELGDIISTDYTSAPQERIDLLALEGAERINLAFPNIEQINIGEIADILKEPKKFPLDDQEIANNVKFLSTLLGKYLAYDQEPHAVIHKTIKQSEARDKCILCKRTLDNSTKDLFAKYKEFFAGEKAKYEEMLRKHHQQLGAIIETLESLSNNKEEGVNKLAELFKIEERWTSIDTKILITDLHSLKNLLEDKIKNPTQEINFSDTITSVLTSLNTTIAVNKKLANNLDTKSNNAGSNLANIRKIIGKMELANFITNHQSYFDQISSSRTEIAKLNDELKAKQAKAPKKSVRQNTSHLFNHFMKKRIGVDKYASDIVNDQIVIKLKEFNISDSTHLISEGEQTMIGLAYFLASSISKLNDLGKFSDAVFVIDDPVSSVSYSNMFGICTLLDTFARDIKHELWSENHTEPTVQVIILTHNIQFLNIMKTQTWKKSNRDGYGIVSPKDIQQIKQKRLLSEFQSALLSIYRESTERNGTNVCNDIRRVSETWRHFYGFKEEFTSDSMKKIFPYVADDNFDNLFKVINHFSHGNPEDFDILPPTIVDDAIVEFVQLLEHDQSPFISLWEEVKSLDGVTQ